jgi:hypothetical protein
VTKVVLVLLVLAGCGGAQASGDDTTPQDAAHDVLVGDASDAGTVDSDVRDGSDAYVCQTVVCRGVCCDPAVPIGGSAVCVDRDPPEYGCCVLVGDSGNCLSPTGDAGSAGE